VSAPGVRSVLVVVTRQIGDVLLTTPLIRRARQQWPDAAVDVLGFSGTLGMLQGNPDVRHAIETAARLGLGGTLHLAARLWRRYDVALVADVGDRAHVIGAVAARRRHGIIPEESSSNWWKRKLLDHAVVAAGDLGEVHVVEEKLALLGEVAVRTQCAPYEDGALPQERGPAAVGCAQGAHRFLVPPPPEPIPPELDRQLQPGYLVVHAPSMWPYKQWPPEHFRSLVQALTQAGRQVVLTGGPSAADRSLVASLQHAAGERAVDAGVLAFGQLVALIRGAALYIGPDTSISHLAAACGVPMIAIFGPTNPQRWAPWPVTQAPVRFARREREQSVGPLTLLQEDLPCVPCGKAGCEDHRHSHTLCLPAITPERVFARAIRMLEGTSALTPALPQRGSEQ
jgi:heptosyltransferase-3